MRKITQETCYPLFKIKRKEAFILQTTLILAAKKGDECALEQLYRQYRPLIYSLRKKYFLRDLDEQDWFQEGFIIFYDCIQAYEINYGVSLGALFKRSFENRIRSLIRREFAYKRKSNVGAVSFEQTIAEGLEDLCRYTSHTEDPLQQLLLEETLLESQSQLSPLEMKALYLGVLKIEGAVFEEDPSMVSAYNRSRRKMTNYFYNQT
ncbi:sigma-70 family RNA polymerase sigma factor [Enterococcus sp. LJL98]